MGRRREKKGGCTCRVPGKETSRLRKPRARARVCVCVCVCVQTKRATSAVTSRMTKLPFVSCRRGTETTMRMMMGFTQRDQGTSCGKKRLVVVPKKDEEGNFRGM
ncbi:hypothetical protein LX32DRAFT_329848 [Colletotrichum zoysiae]|uniref:Uncharacterized protein n=1 Tax=Colletotrichum zoysiae TaxID=1216348 RepID=A0AAD9H2S5_9PEZI|nr:hypothetical protein LX32DRAFT_329848 [Colletotrichum zoysiae]